METKEMNVRGLNASRYETLKAEVSTIEPAGVLCQSSGYSIDYVGVLPDDSGNWM